jgi:hypothetical protein
VISRCTNTLRACPMRKARSVACAGRGSSMMTSALRQGLLVHVRTCMHVLACRRQGARTCASTAGFHLRESRM